MREFLLSMNGRISRKAIWIFLGVSALLILLAFMIDYAMGYHAGNGAPNVTLAMRVMLFWPSTAVSIKRFHDLNLSFLFALPVLTVEAFSWIEYVFHYAANPEEKFAPLLASNSILAIGIMILYLAQFIILFFFPGTRGPNRFGSDLKGATK